MFLDLFDRYTRQYADQKLPGQSFFHAFCVENLPEHLGFASEQHDLAFLDSFDVLIDIDLGSHLSIAIKGLLDPFR